MRGLSGPTQHGLTLIELVIAIAIGSLILAGLNSIVMVGLQAQAPIEAANEQVYRAGFALERIVARVRATPLKALSAASADSTGDWLEPVMFCRVSASQTLRETTTSDTACSGGAVLAEGVTAFSIARMADVPGIPITRFHDAPVLTVSLTVHLANVPQPIVLTQSVRLGGGAS